MNQLLALLYPDFVADFESFVKEDQLFKELGESAVFADVTLESGDAVRADDEPQLQTSKATTQRYAPMLYNLEGMSLATYSSEQMQYFNAKR
jgi:hypothetical protein